jgi:hypothetical protein
VWTGGNDRPKERAKGYDGDEGGFRVYSGMNEKVGNAMGRRNGLVFLERERTGGVKSRVSHVVFSDDSQFSEISAKDGAARKSKKRK